MIEQNSIVIVQDALKVILLASAPPLLFGLVIGVIVSIFQTITSIQEPTLAFVPKIIAVFAAIYFFGKWMMDLIAGFAAELFARMPELMSMFRMF